MRSKKPKILLERIALLESQLKNERAQNLPFLIKTGAICKHSDVIDYLNDILITPNHMIVLSEILLDQLWLETNDGMPSGERRRILKDLQFDIHRLFEISLAAKALRVKFRQ